MEPIISPWIIYIVSMLTTLKVTILSLLGLACMVAFVAMIVAYIDPLVTEIGKKRSKYVFKLSCISIAILAIFNIILPSKDVLLSMIVLQYITPDNIQLVQGNVVDFISQIVQTIKNGG